MAVVGFLFDPSHAMATLESEFSPYIVGVSALYFFLIFSQDAIFGASNNGRGSGASASSYSQYALPQ
jgi:hypothetical protein